MENLDIYEKARCVPSEAQKTIKAGRLQGMTDINPMWRIKTLTEMFGPCGIGWKTIITGKHIEEGADGEKVAIVDADLYIKIDGAWSDAICGTGGSMLVASERSGPHTSDEAYKMAYTDAISVCCKMLGMGADIYWNSDKDKYTSSETAQLGKEAQLAAEGAILCSVCGKQIKPMKYDGKLYTAKDIADRAKNTYGKVMCWDCADAAKKASNA